MAGESTVWPPGNGEMARRIREFDWSATPLGPIEAWPGRLRAAVELMLAAQQPVYIAWSPAAISLYNDGYIPILGSKHPNALGQPYAVVWSEIWDEYRPILAATLAGEAQYFVDQPVPLAGRPGRPMSWFTFSWTPLRDDEGAFAGFFCAATETTDDVLARARQDEIEERQAFLLALSDALRPLADPIAIQGAACRLLGEHLEVDRAYYVEVDEAAGIATVERDWVRGNGPSLAGAHQVADFAWSVAILRRGECHVIPNTQTSPLVPPADRPASAALQITGCAGAPLIKGGRLVGALCVTTAQSRAWADAEVELLREVGERIWASIERARAEEALHDREAKYRTLFETMGQGYVLAELVRDETGEAVDILLLELNPAYERLMGVRAEEARGRRVHELFPDVDRWWVEHFDRAVRVGCPERLEHQYNDRGGWFEAWVYPRGQDRFVALFEEITARKQAEAALRESEDRQRFLLALSDALRACPDGESIKERTVAMLGKHLRLDRCYVSEVFEREGYSTVGPEHVRPGLPSMAGVYRLADYPETMRQLMTQPMIVDDAEADPRFSDAEKAMLALVPQRALLVTPLRKGSREVVWALAGAMGTPRRWTEGERLLLEEVAERTWAAVERTRAEAALRQSEARLRQALEIETVGVVFYDELGRVTDVNDAFRRFSRLNGADLAAGQLSWRDLTAPEWWPAVRTLFAALAIGQRAAQHERQFLRRNKERWWGLAAPKRLADGRIVEYVLDVTERKRAEAALRSSEERLRAIVEEATDYAIFTTDATGAIDGWLPGAEAVFGWTADEAIGQSFEITFTPEDRAAGEPERELAGAKQADAAPNVRWHVRKDDRLVFIEGVARARRGPNGAFQGLLKIGRDATERRRAEDERHEQEARARHELERRVAEATAELRALSRRLLTVQEEERRALARELHDEIGQTLTGLSLQLGVGSAPDAARLDESRRIVAGLTEQVRLLSMDLRPAALDVYGLLPALRSHLERYERQTGVRVDFRHEGIARRLPSPIEIAAYRIVQEALTNVARHAGVNRAEVRLFADDAALIVSVCDEGAGFNPTATSGSGLGGMRERAELLGGTLTVDAAPGKGVAVTAELPICELAASENQR